MELKHYGIPGMRWGVRNGPPYPLRGGTTRTTKSDSRRYGKVYKKTRKEYSNSNKRHVDITLKKGTELQTMTYDADRLKNTDMFFTVHDKHDKAQFAARFSGLDSVLKWSPASGKPCPEYKLKVNSVTKFDMKVASQDSMNAAFKKVYEKDRDFYNYVTDPNRMMRAIKLAHHQGTLTDLLAKDFHAGYRALKKISKTNGEYVPTEKEVRSLGDIFTLIAPSDGSGDAKLGHDIYVQRNKLYSELKSQGYGAMLDTYDSLNHYFGTNSPVVVFDTNKIAQTTVTRMTRETIKSAEKEYRKGRDFMQRVWDLA